MRVMAKRRSYGEACGIPRALDVVGERWTLLVVRELLLGPKRFNDIRTELKGLSADVLAQRLRELEEAGVVAKRRLAPPASVQVYELTPAGVALEPVLLALGQWGGTYAAPPAEGAGMSLDAHVVSLRTLFRADLARDLAATFALRLGEHAFRAEVRDGAFTIERGEADGADATIETDPATLIDVAHGRRTLAGARRFGDLRISGDDAAATRFLGLFPLPEPAAA